ncbi:MAG: hypothetical protein WC456_00300 [Patescibacteria group bacterium]
MRKLFLTKWPFLFKLRLFFALSALIIGLIFLYLKIVPGGQISYSKSWPGGLRSGKGFIYDFKPAERMSAASEFLKIVADPVYFSLFTPRRFDEAVLTIRYRDRLGTTTPLFEAGVLKDKLTGHYELRPLQNDVIDDLRFRWPRLEDSAALLILQAERNYDSADAFFSDLQAGQLRDCPGGPTACVAVYNYPLTFDYRLPDYAPLKPLKIEQPLRGPHQFYLYLKDESWRLSLDFSDLNQDKEQDPISVQVRGAGGVIAHETLGDNNPTPDNGRVEEKRLVLSGQSQPTGVYKVSVDISSDVVIARIISSSDKLSFLNKIWPVSGTGSLTLFTDAAYLEASTLNPASLGVITFAGRDQELSQTGQPFVFSAPAGVKELILRADDIRLANNGVLAFSRDSLFNPGFKKLDRYLSTTTSVRYVVADYQQPIYDEGWKTATARFSLGDADRENGRYSFLLSIPGLNGSADAPHYLEIKEIEVSLQGKTLGRRLLDLFKSLWQ